MSTITVKDGTTIYYKDWGSGQPVVFSHGWPLSADDWDTQMMFFLNHGYRVIAHDRRGHGRSSQTADGHDMDHYADDAKPSPAVIWNWWRQGMMGGAKEHYDGIVAFSQTDFTEDLKQISVPVLVMHGDDDQIVGSAFMCCLSLRRSPFVRRELGQGGVTFWSEFAIVASIILLSLLAHLIGIALWADVFKICGEFHEFDLAFNHSLSTTQ